MKLIDQQTKNMFGLEFLYLSKMGNGFSNKIKTNKIQGRRQGGRAPSSAFSGKGQTRKFGPEWGRPEIMHAHLIAFVI